MCGNGITEPSEDCDYSVFGDKCCTSDCHLATIPGTNQSYACSPSKGVCCTDQCTFKTTSDICLTSSDCSGSITCSGSSAVCPIANNSTASNITQPDGSYCNNNTQTCFGGVRRKHCKQS